MEKKIDFREMTDGMVSIQTYNNRDRTFLYYQMKHKDFVVYSTVFPGQKRKTMFVEKTAADRELASRETRKQGIAKISEPAICPSELRAELAVMRKKLDVITFHSYRNHVILTKIAEELNLKIDYED
jgi:hypothetical protein